MPFSERAVLIFVVAVKETSAEVEASTPTSMMGTFTLAPTDQVILVPRAISVSWLMVMAVASDLEFLNVKVLFAPFVFEFWMKTSERTMFLMPLDRV